MTRCFLLLLLLVFSFLYVHAQKMPEDYWLEAKRAEHSGKDSVAALNNFLHIINNYPAHPLSSMAYVYVGKAYERQNQLPEAITVYRSAIATALTINIYDQLKRFNEWFDGDYAACRLYNLYYERGRYDSALYYLGIKDTVFAGMHGCEGYLDRSDVVTKYADLYTKTGRIRDAEAVLLKNMWSLSIMEKLRELYIAHEQPQQLKSEIESAINNYVLDTVFENRDGCTDTVVYLKFSFRGVPMGGFITGRSSGNMTYDAGSDAPDATDPESLLAYLKKHELYTMIRGL